MDTFEKIMLIIVFCVFASIPIYGYVCHLIGKKRMESGVDKRKLQYIMSIIDRIKQFAEYEKVSIRRFCEITGIANGAFTRAKGVGSENLLRIHYAFPDINLEWLMKGIGSSLEG